MRVLHYVDTSRPGGIETHLLHLLPALRAEGIGAELLLHRRYGPHPLVDALSAACVPVSDVGGSLRRLRQRLMETPGTVLHTHGYKAGILGRPLARALGVPVVSTMHSGAAGSGRVGLWSRIDSLSSRLARQVVVSPAQADAHPRAVFVPNGITLPAMPDRTGASVAFVGRMSAEKGPVDFARLAARLPHLRFVAFGDGPLRPEAQAAAGGAVTFRGEVADMGPHWPEVGLLVMPSVFEGLPMAALEAMARGIPVAAYGVGGLPRLLDGCGFVVPPGDADGLERAVADWAAEAAPQRADRRLRCRARVASDHDIRRAAQRLASLYRGEAPQQRPALPGAPLRTDQPETRT